jgi:UDP-3-O-[3-hydroxymyristoyl] glucosamine N-acyltransferase
MRAWIEESVYISKMAYTGRGAHTGRRVCMGGHTQVGRRIQVGVHGYRYQVRRLGRGVYIVQASWSMEDHGSVRRVSLGGR